MRCTYYCISQGGSHFQLTKSIFQCFNYCIVILIIILPKLFGLGVNGVLLAEPVSNIIGGLACFITMMFTVYKPLKSKPDTLE